MTDPAVETSVPETEDLGIDLSDVDHSQSATLEYADPYTDDEPESEADKGKPAAVPEVDAAENTGDGTATASDKDPWDALSRDERADLLNVARGMGMKDHEAREWTPEGLKTHLSRIYQAEQARQQQILQQGQKPPETPQSQFKVELDKLDGEINPDLLEQLRGFYGHHEQVAAQHAQYQKELQAANQKLAQQEQLLNRLDAEAREARTERFEQRISALGHEKIFGKGSIHDLPASSPLRANRIKLFEEMQRFIPGNGTAPPLGEGAAFERALNSLFHRELADLSKQQLSEELQKQSKRTTSRPTAKSGKPASGLERARQIMREFDAKHL